MAGGCNGSCSFGFPFDLDRHDASDGGKGDRQSDLGTKYLVAGI